MKLPRFQFGLRALLISVAVIAFVFWAWPKWQRQRTLHALDAAVEGSWTKSTTAMKGPGGGHPDYEKIKAATDRVAGIEATDDAVTLLVEQLQTSDPQVRANAAVALGQLGPAAKDAVPALLEVLDDETVASGSAVFALQQIGEGGEPVARALIVLLRDEQAFPTLRYQAAVGLGQIGEFNPVLELIKQEQLQWATASFGQMGPRTKGALPKVREMLTSDKPEQRAAAVDILSHIEPHVKEAVALITKMQDDEDEMVREHAASGLSFIKLVKQHASRGK